MHYKVKGGLIKTENAAKPVSQASRFLLDWINHLSNNLVVLDYGCGKFRYTIPLSGRVKTVYAVDSIFQIEREQIINNVRTKLTSYAKQHASNIRVFDVKAKEWCARKYDVILCANVLSAIPVRIHRQNVLERLYIALKRGGRLLLTTQYRNSYFTSYERRPNAKKYLDGWLVESRHGNFFYGIIRPCELERLCIRAGFSILQSGSKGETAYVLATK